MAEFMREFKQRYESLAEELEKIESEKSGDAALDAVGGQLRQLKIFLSENAHSLTKYDLKRRQTDIKTLEDALTLKSNEISSKNSFSFAGFSRSIEEPVESFSFSFSSTTKVDDEKEETMTANDTQLVQEPAIVSPSDDSFTISNVSNQDFVFKGDEAKKIAGKELIVSNISNCRIKCFTHLPAVRINKAVDCEILCGPVSTSVFVEDATNCSFVMAAQQFRIHSSRDCRFYIHVTSKAIIEQCRELAFAPYNLQYDAMLDDFWAANLRLYDVANNWDKVDDFDWPSASSKRPSPNWSVLPENKRVSSWT